MVFAFPLKYPMNPPMLELVPVTFPVAAEVVIFVLLACPINPPTVPAPVTTRFVVTPFMVTEEVTPANPPTFDAVFGRLVTMLVLLIVILEILLVLAIFPANPPT
ncbi:hypothetical protein D3C80_1233480 [compost metagenome]